MRYVVRIQLETQSLVREYPARLPAMQEYHLGHGESVHAIPDYDGGDEEVIES